MSQFHSLATEVHKPQSPVQLLLLERFPHLNAVTEELRQEVAGQTTLTPTTIDEPTPYSMIGMGVDYRLRYYFRETYILAMAAFDGARYARGPAGAESDSALNDHVRVPRRPVGPGEEPHAWESIPRIARDFFESLEALVSRLHPTRRILRPEDELLLSRYCFVLALFEHSSRLTGSLRPHPALQTLRRDATVEDLLDLADDEWVKDIGRMAVLFGRRYPTLLHARVKVNPSHLSRVGGFDADADLLINNYLTDIKTTPHPDGAVWREERLHELESIPHHREPDRVFERVVVVFERLLRVEGWIEVGQLDLACVFVPELGDRKERGHGLEGVAPDQEVIFGPLLIVVGRHNCPLVVQKVDFSDPIVGGRDPLVASVLVRQETLGLIGPGQLQAAGVLVLRIGHGDIPLTASEYQDTGEIAALTTSGSSFAFAGLGRRFRHDGPFSHHET